MNSRNILKNEQLKESKVLENLKSDHFLIKTINIIKKINYLILQNIIKNFKKD